MALRARTWKVWTRLFFKLPTVTVAKVEAVPEMFVHEP